MLANDFDKAFEFVRKEMRDACIEIVKTEADAIIGDGNANVCQRMIDKMRKLGPIK